MQKYVEWSFWYAKDELTGAELDSLIETFRRDPNVSEVRYLLNQMDESYVIQVHFKSGKSELQNPILGDDEWAARMFDRLRARYSSVWERLMGEDIV